MADSFLNKTGLAYFWSKLKSYFVAQESGKTLSSNDYTDADKAKVNTIEDYLPLSGGTMDAGATITIPYASDSRALLLTPAGIRYQMPDGSGSAQGITWYEADDSSTIAAQMGLYNGPTAGIRYLYFGGTYSEPLMKLSAEGDLTCTTSSADTFYEGGTALSAKYRQWRYGTVGSVASAEQPYYKMASIEITGASTPAKLSLKVTDGFNANAYGILTARVRTGSVAAGAPSYATLYWEYLAGKSAVLSDYILAYKATDNSFLAEVWYHASSTYNTIHFCELLEAGNNTKQSQSAWTLYSGTGLGETEIGSDYTQVISSLPTLRNPIADLEDSGWVDMTLSAGSTAISSITLQYRTIGKQLYIKGSFTTNSSISAGGHVYLASSTTVGSGNAFAAGSGSELSTTGAGITCYMYTNGVNYLEFQLPTALSSGTTIYFGMSGVID